MKRWLVLVVVACFLIPVLGISEANPILVQEWWNAPVEVIIDARDRLNRAIVDKGGEAVTTGTAQNTSSNTTGSTGTTSENNSASAASVFLSGSSSSTTQNNGQYAKCTGNNVNVRAMPDKNAKSIGQIKRNETVYVLDFGDGGETSWAHISTQDGEGYVLSKYLEVTGESGEGLNTANTQKKASQKSETPKPSTKEEEKSYSTFAANH